MEFLRSRQGSAPPDGRVARDPDDAQVIAAAWASDIGNRAENQDRARVSPAWVIVSDGVGGQAGGSLAAELTVSHVEATLGSGPDGFDEQRLTDALDDANEAVRSARLEDRTVDNMGATLTMAAAASVTPERSTWLVANVGDSPAWLLTADGASQITEDHTLTAALVRSGALAPEDAATHPQRHVIVRAIGAEERVEADMRTVDLHPGEALVIATDGLSDVLGAAEIAAAAAGATTAATIADRLVAAALERNTSDNVTVAVLCHLQSCTDGRPSP